MPSSYAHYRFGTDSLPRLPDRIQALVRHSRQFYDFGLHGPDLFFYYNPAFPTKTGQLGFSLHKLSGVSFFQRSARRLRMNPTDDAAAYLYGVLAHYCLDSHCHPAICSWAGEGPAVHTQIETEFDRFLLEKDGRIPPLSQNFSSHMKLSKAESRVVAGFYAPVSPEEIFRCSRNMVFFTSLLATPAGGRRKFIATAAKALGRSCSGMVMTSRPDPQCCCYDAPLLKMYEQAFDAYPEMAAQLQAHIADGTSLGALFVPVFG